MDGGINSDQNFYSRPPFPRPPTASDDDIDPSRFDYDYNHQSSFDRPPLVPPKVPLATSNLHATAINGYGPGATGESDSPAPDDFYRNFDAFQSGSYNMTNGTPATSSTRPAPSSLRSNGNGTTPKHPAIPASARNGVKSSIRSVSTPIDQRMASLNTAKSASALNNGYTKPPQQASVRDLLKKFDDNKVDSAQKPAFRPTNIPSSVGYNRFRTTSENLPPNNSRAGLASRDVDRAKSPTAPRTQRAKFAAEDQHSNNTLSAVARPGRSQFTENAQATRSMTNLSPRIPPKPIQTPAKRPLFGEVVVAGSSSSLGYGIVDTRARRTSDSSIHRPAWSRNDDEPTSPSAWYRAVTPALLDDVESKSPRRKHNRSQSDLAGGKISPDNRLHVRAPSQSRLPIISKPLSTHNEVKTPPSTRATSRSTSPFASRTPPRATTRSTSPFASRTPPRAATRSTSPFASRTTSSAPKIRNPDPRPWSPAGRATPPSHSRSPGRPTPGKINTNSSLKAYISAPPPKQSPPLRSSRPRQPVSTATTASSRSKAADKSETRNGMRSSRARVESRSNSRLREPSPSNEQLKAAAARATKAISRSIEQREAERRRRELAEHPTMGTAESTPHIRESSRPVTPSATSPKLTVNTSFLSPTPQQYVNVSNPDSPTLGMPGSFPNHDYDEDEPYSAISAATGVTEFDNEAQTEPPQQGGELQSPKDSDPTFHFEAEDLSNDTVRQSTATDNGSIKIILDTSSLEDAESIPTQVNGEHRLEMGAPLDHSQPGESVFTTIDTPLDLSTPNANPSHQARQQDTSQEAHYFDDAQFYGEPTSGFALSASFESEKLNEWATSPYHPPPLHLPYLNTGMDMTFDTTNSRPDYLETPVTEIDYESSEAGGETAALPNNEADRLAGSLSTLGSRPDRESHQSAWTNFTVNTYVDNSWQHEPAYPPPVAPPLFQARRPTPPPKEEMQFARPDVPPKALDYSPLPSPHTIGATPTLPSPSHPSNTGYAENLGFNHFQLPPITPIPALPNHSPPPLPQDAFVQKSNRTPPPSSYRRPPSIMQRDSESRRTSEDVTSSRPSQSTTRTSNLDSELTSLTSQQTDDTKTVVLLGEEKEAAEKQARRLQHRGRVIKEIIDTEAVYLKDMNVVEEIYKGTAEACPKLEHNDVSIIFRNTNEIVAFSTMFLDELKAASVSVYSPRQKARRQSRSTTATTSTMSPSRDSVSTIPSEESDIEKDRKTFIGHNFGRHLPQMQIVYTDFLKSSERASSRLTELQSDAAVKVWLGECNHVAKDLTAAWDLDALLIKPVQRITRYQLLLKDLLDNTPEDHPDFEALKTTSKGIGDLLKNIDDLKKRIDTVGKIVGVTRKRKESDVRMGLAKAFGRRDKAVIGNSNRPPEDVEYAKLHQSWGHDFIQLQIILRDVENYTRKAHTWVNDFLRYLSAIELVMRVKASSYPELESKWARFNMSMRDMGTVALEDHVSNIRKQVIEPLEQVIKAYGPPELAMKKRTKRRLDYEKSLALKAANKKIDEKLAEMVDQYTALNETLKFELPKLSMLTMKLGKICLTRLVSIQADWYNIWTAKVKTVLEESEMPKDFTDIIDKFNRDYKYQLKKADSLAILNGSFLENGPKGRSSQSTQSTSATREDEQRYSPRPSSISNGWSRNPPPILMSRSRGLSVNSDHSPRLPTPDFRRSSGHEFTFSPVVTDSPGLPIFSTRDFPPSNTHSRAGSGSPATSDIPMSRPNLSRPPTGRSYDSGPVSRRSVESGYASASFSPAQFDGASDSPRDRPPPSARPYSGLFHSAMPPADGADDSQRSSRASSQDRDRSGGYNVLYIAASLFEFNISATKSEAGYPYLTYGAGEVFDVIGEKGELWLAKNQDDPSDLVGWIWSKHFARLATD